MKNERARPDLTFRDTLLPAALYVGTFQGLAIARYDVLMDSLSRGVLLRTVAWLAVIVALEVGLWWGLFRLLARVVPERWVPNGVVVLAGVLTAAARWLLDDRTLAWGYGWLAGAVLMAILPLPPRVRTAQLGSAGVVIAAFSLLGRVPDFSFPLADIGSFLAVSAAIAIVLTAAALRTPVALALLAVTFVALGPLVEAGRPRPEGPNVLWVLVDTVRRDHVEPFGDRVDTPAIARLAAEGVTFQNAVTVIPKTPGSVASYFTGLYPIRHGVRGLYDHLSPEIPTIAEAMADAGYETAAFVNNAWLSRGRGFARGFTRYHGFHEVYAPYGPPRYLSSVVLLDRLVGRRIHGFDGQTSARLLTSRVDRFLDRRHDRPFFAYVHYFEPHWPYLPPPEWEARYEAPPGADALVNRIQETDIGRERMVFHNDLPEVENEAGRRLYRGEIGNTMAEIGRLIEHLDGRRSDASARDDTIVIFSADHGHSLGDHDYYFHHGEFIYDSSIQVPLVIRWRGHLPAGTQVAAQVRSIDLPPTILDLCGIAPKGRIDGVTLRDTWSNPRALGRTAFLESDVKMFAGNTRRELPGIVGKQRGLRRDDYKFILTPLGRGPAIELYNLREDPGEEHNLAGEEAYKEIVARWSAELSAAMPRREVDELAAFYAAGATANEGRTIDPNEERLLRSLGYIQ